VGWWCSAACVGEGRCGTNVKKQLKIIKEKKNTIVLVATFQRLALRIITGEDWWHSMS